jgi:hypothetical protein
MYELFVLLAKLVPYLPEPIQQRIHEAVGDMVNNSVR